MNNDIRLTAEEATTFHYRKRNAMVMWCVTRNPSDYPGMTVARAHMILPGKSVALRTVLVAATLEAIREQLPHGLARLERDPDDDPIIAEVWL